MAILELYFEGPGHSFLGIDQRCCIYLKGYGTSREGGLPELTSNCVTFKELNTEIDGLIRDLERLREAARAKFSEFEV